MKKINVGNDEIFSQQERENILEKVKSFYENKLAEKDKQQNYFEIIKIYDDKNTVFYLDLPYYIANISAMYSIINLIMKNYYII